MKHLLAAALIALAGGAAAQSFVVAPNGKATDRASYLYVAPTQAHIGSSVARVPIGSACDCSTSLVAGGVTYCAVPRSAPLRLAACIAAKPLVVVQPPVVAPPPPPPPIVIVDPPPIVVAPPPAGPPDMSGMIPVDPTSLVRDSTVGLSVPWLEMTNEAGAQEVRGAGSEGMPPGSDFRQICDFSHMAKDDPIVFPGQPGKSHAHVFFGNTAADAFLTPENIRKVGKSTCRGGTIDLSARWQPAMIDDRTGKALQPLAMIAYYKSGAWVDIKQIQPLPVGLRMIAGDPKATDSIPNGAGTFSCAGTPVPGADPHAIPNCTGGEARWAGVLFPQCWDGKNLDSPDHRSHMAYVEIGPGTNRLSNGCPSHHPVLIPLITLTVVYPAAADVDQWKHLRLASDMYDRAKPGGYSLHADWFNGWDPEIQKAWTFSCLNVGKDCGAELLGDNRRMGYCSGKTSGCAPPPRAIAGGWQQVASETQPWYSLDKPTLVRMGPNADGTYLQGIQPATRYATNACDSSWFPNGAAYRFGQPARFCEIQTPNPLSDPPVSAPPVVVAPPWTKIADEGGMATLVEPQIVRFGAGSTWNEKPTPAGMVMCDNATFGPDPVFGVVKECDLKAGPAIVIPPPPPPIDHAGMGPMVDVSKYASADPAMVYTTNRVQKIWHRDLDHAPWQEPCVEGEPGCVLIDPFKTFVNPNDIGAFREVLGFAGMNNDDAIVYPGQPGRAHSHTYFGNLIDASATSANLRANCKWTTAAGGLLNCTSVWIPTMVDTLDGTPKVPSVTNFYYKCGYEIAIPEGCTRIVPIPVGLHMISGDAKNSNEAGAISTAYACLGAKGENSGFRGSITSAVSSGFCYEGSELLTSTVFPQCWDGVNLDSPDHRSHLSDTEQFQDATGFPKRCPASHPVEIPKTSTNTHYAIAKGDDVSRWRLASDMYNPVLPAGLSGHADYFYGWDPAPHPELWGENASIVEMWTKHCLNEQRDCHNYLIGDNTNALY